MTDTPETPSTPDTYDQGEPTETASLVRITRGDNAKRVPATVVPRFEQHGWKAETTKPKRARRRTSKD